MVIVKAVLSNFLAFLMAFFITEIPYKGIELPVIDNEKDNCCLNLQLMSDTHLEANGVFRQSFVKAGLNNIKNAKVPIDAILIAGDLTNYGDEPALREFFELMDKYSPAPFIPVGGNHDIGHVGDRDVTDITREEARDNLIRYRNQYMHRNDTVNYFSVEVNGYKIIGLGDEVLDGGSWDSISMTEEQLQFLDRELADGTKDGKPVFVMAHWPVHDTNGEQTSWPGCGIEPEEYDLHSIMKKYKNVFYISGHMHSGFKAQVINEKYGLSNAEQIDGVTYLNLPSYGILNIFGIPWSGTGAQLEVYEDEVIFRPRNFIVNYWFKNAEFSFELVK